MYKTRYGPKRRQLHATVPGRRGERTTLRSRGGGGRGEHTMSLRWIFHTSVITRDLKKNDGIYSNLRISRFWEGGGTCSNLKSRDLKKEVVCSRISNLEIWRRKWYALESQISRFGYSHSNLKSRDLRFPYIYGNRKSRKPRFEGEYPNLEI